MRDVFLMENRVFKYTFGTLVTGPRSYAGTACFISAILVANNIQIVSDLVPGSLE